MIINRIAILRRLRLELETTLQRAPRVCALPFIKIVRLVARQQGKHILQTRHIALPSTSAARVHAQPRLAGGFRHGFSVAGVLERVLSAIARRRRRRERAWRACVRSATRCGRVRAGVRERAPVRVTEPRGEV